MKQILCIFFLCCFSQAFSSRISEAYKALSLYDYFKAKQLFYKALPKYPGEASFGLSTIFFRTDNPFSNIDSAAKYIALSKAQFKDTGSFSGYSINPKAIQSLSKEICFHGFQKYTFGGTINDYQNFLTRFYFAEDSLINEVCRKRDEKSLGNYVAYESSDSVYAFLRRYPETVLYKKATRLFFDFQYFENTSEHTAREYKRFIKTYNKNPNVKYAELKLFELTKQLHQADSLYAFVKHYSSEATQNEAWKMLYSTSVKNYSQKELSAFMEKYPDYPYSESIIKEISLAQKMVWPVKNESDKMGFVDTLGNWVIQPMYDDAGLFSEGLAAVCQNDSCFFIDKEGVKASDFYYDETESYQNGIAIVKKEKSYFLINRSGQFVSKGYEDISEMSENLFVCKQNGVYGAINPKGDVVIPFNYTKLGNFKNGYAYYLSEHYGLVDVFNATIKAQWDWISDVDQYAMVTVKKGAKFGLMTIHEQLLLKPEYDYISHCEQGIYLVVKQNQYGFYDVKGRCFVTAVEYDYDSSYDSQDYCNGSQFKLWQDDDVALIDGNGKFKVNFGTYSNLFFEKEEVIRVQKNNKYGYVDKKLKVVIPIEFEKATDFDQHVAIVTKAGVTSLITKSGKITFSIKGGLIEQIESGCYKMVVNGLVGLIHADGGILLHPDYTNIEPLYSHFFRCEKEGSLFFYNALTHELSKM